MLRRTIITARNRVLSRLKSCREVVPTISESFERPLSARETVSMWTHLILCRWCMLYLRQLRLIRDIVLKSDYSAAIAESDHSTTLPAGARTRILETLHNSNSD